MNGLVQRIWKAIIVRHWLEYSLYVSCDAKRLHIFCHLISMTVKNCFNYSPLHRKGNLRLRGQVTFVKSHLEIVIGFNSRSNSWILFYSLQGCLSFFFFFFLFVYLFIVSFWYSALHLVGKQKLYYLSHTASPFCFSSFLDRVSYLCHPGQWASCLYFLHNWDDMWVPPTFYWLRREPHQCLPILASNCGPPQLYLPAS
jgi:hypothetical protein